LAASTILAAVDFFAGTIRRPSVPTATLRNPRQND
jgi:hypothetical protein